MPKFKPTKCHVCNESSCGDQEHVLSTIKVERNVGDRMKVVLEMAYQMVDYDNLQKHEIIALFAATVEFHIHEEDLLNPEHT